MNVTNPSAVGRIPKIELRREADPCADVSDLGTYTDRPGPECRTVDRQARGDMGRGEFRYFVAAASTAETGNPDSVEEDYRRAEALNRGEWCYLGITAEARVCLPGSMLIQKITSGGLYGVESDSGEEYLKEVERDQLEDMKAELLLIGFSPADIRAAVERAGLA